MVIIVVVVVVIRRYILEGVREDSRKDVNSVRANVESMKEGLQGVSKAT